MRDVFKIMCDANKIINSFKNYQHGIERKQTGDPIMKKEILNNILCWK